MRIAVIGTGVAGLGVAYALSRIYDVELFEANGYAGGHVHTVTVGSQELDTGFIVHNEPNYPNLTRLFGELGVTTLPSEMSFSVSCGCGLEWSSRRPWLAGPRLLHEVTRFLRVARAEDARDRTLAQFVRERGFSESFRRHYLVPMTSALWSMGPVGTLDFPAETLLRFFANHGMLGFRRHRWRTVRGGARTYVLAVLARVAGPVHLGLPVRSLARTGGGVELRTDDGQARRFDAAVVATHAPQALGLLADPSDEERRLLGLFRTTANETVLHTDSRCLPRREGARAAWNVHVDGCGDGGHKPAITYLLNRLQKLEAADRFCVTLNRTDEIDPERIIRVIRYEHPLVTAESVAAQPRLGSLNGPRATAFCGAWQGNGFHEDGLVSGLAAAAALGVRW